MEWLGWGLICAGGMWFFVATFVGGARSLLLSTALFVAGILLYTFG